MDLLIVQPMSVVYDILFICLSLLVSGLMEACHLPKPHPLVSCYAAQHGKWSVTDPVAVEQQVYLA